MRNSEQFIFFAIVIILVDEKYRLWSDRGFSLYYGFPTDFLFESNAVSQIRHRSKREWSVDCGSTAENIVVQSCTSMSTEFTDRRSAIMRRDVYDHKSEPGEFYRVSDSSAMTERRHMSERRNYCDDEQIVDRCLEAD